MIRAHFRPLSWIVVGIAVLGLVGIPYVASTAWAGNEQQKGMKPMAQRSQAHRGQMMGTSTSAPGLMLPAPRTVDEYADFVQDKLQQEARKIRQAGTAEVKLTIGKDGSVRQTDVVRVNGPATLREQVMPLVNRAGPFPPLPGEADVLVVSAPLAFNYPSTDLYDKFGRGQRRGG